MSYLKHILFTLGHCFRAWIKLLALKGNGCWSWDSCARTAWTWAVCLVNTLSGRNSSWVPFTWSWGCWWRIHYVQVDAELRVIWYLGLKWVYHRQKSSLFPIAYEAKETPSSCNRRKPGFQLQGCTFSETNSDSFHFPILRDICVLLEFRTSGASGRTAVGATSWTSLSSYQWEAVILWSWTSPKVVVLRENWRREGLCWLFICTLPSAPSCVVCKRQREEMHWSDSPSKHTVECGSEMQIPRMGIAGWILTGQHSLCGVRICEELLPHRESLWGHPRHRTNQAGLVRLEDKPRMDTWGQGSSFCYPKNKGQRVKLFQSVPLGTEIIIEKQVQKSRSHSESVCVCFFSVFL